MADDLGDEWWEKQPAGAAGSPDLLFYSSPFLEETDALSVQYPVKHQDIKLDSSSRPSYILSDILLILSLSSIP